MNSQTEIKRASTSHLGTTLSPDPDAFRHARSSEPLSRATDKPRLMREVAATSRDIDRSVDVVVCIPAFRRPLHLRATLSSIAAQTTERRLAVVIVENDATGRSSIPEAARFLAENSISGLCVIEPRQGNCRAINAAFETALTAFPQASAFLMIDDDEIASPNWLERMVAASETTGAEIVGGPVLARFADGHDDYLAAHPAFRPAYDETGPVPIIYGSGNCLIRRRVFETLTDPTFDLRFNFLGGGDTDFFSRCRQLGLKFHWAADAVITETVPESRTSLRWLTRRGLRIGAINYHVQRKMARTNSARLKLLAKITALLPLSVIRTGRLIASREAVTIALHPTMVAIGSILAAVGIEQQPYKASEMKSESFGLSPAN